MRLRLGLGLNPANPWENDMPLIETWTADGTTDSKTFTLPTSDYNDLVVTYSAKSGSTASASAELRCQFNGDTGANYDHDRVQANGDTAVGSGTRGETSGFVSLVTASSTAPPAGEAGRGVIDLPAFRDAFKKQIHGRSGIKIGEASDAEMWSFANTIFWRNTAALTSLTLFLSTGNYVSGSTIRLYARN